jgi:hypothetical protein
VSWSQYGTSLIVGGGIPMLPVVLVPFVRADPQIAAVLNLIFLAPPLMIAAIAAMTRQPGEHKPRRHDRIVLRESAHMLDVAGKEQQNAA